MQLDDLDLTPLINEGLSRGVQLSEEDLGKVVDLNFRTIYYYRLNKLAFVVTPKSLMEKMVRLLQLNTRVETLIGEGRTLTAKGNSEKQRRKVVRDISDSAKKLDKMFRVHFVDMRSSPYRVVFRRQDSKDILFIHYLIQLDQVNRVLGQELDRYFFSLEPQVVELSEFSDSSISTLSKSIVKLSLLADEGLRR